MRKIMTTLSMDVCMKLPIDLIIHQKSRELELVYEDDVARLSFEFLRVMSPSAEVQGHTPEDAVLQVGKRLVNILGIEPVGNYAIQIIFSDGHDSGIYSWDYLENLIMNHDVFWKAYLDALKKAGASREPCTDGSSSRSSKIHRSCSRH